MSQIVRRLALFSLPAVGLLLSGAEARAQGWGPGYPGGYSRGYGWGGYGYGYGWGGGRVVDVGRPGGRVYIDPGRPGGRLIPGYDPGYPGGWVYTRPWGGSYRGGGYGPYRPYR